MDIDNIIDRAVALLGFMDAKSAAVVLADAGVPNDMAFFALKAAEILVTPAPLPYSHQEQEAGHALADMEDAARLDWYTSEDNSEYQDRMYTGAVRT